MPPYNTWFLGAHVSMPSTAARSVPPFLYESRFSDKRTHRQTDHATHWRNFTLKSGGNQWRRQDLMSGGTTIEVPKAPSGVGYGLWGGVSAPQPTRGSGGAS